MKDQCKQAVAKALGKTQLTQQEADNIEQRIRDAMKSRARQDIDAWRNLSDSEKLTAAGEQVAIDIKADIKRKNKIAANDILTQSKNLAQLDHPTLSASEVIDRMVAPHGDMSGIQSLDSKARAIASIYRGDLTDFYTNIKGGSGVFTDLDLVQNIVRERFNENTSDTLAKKISDKMGDVFESMRERFNRSGGDIGKLDDWGLPQTHNLEKIAKVGKDEWVNRSEQLIDTSKYVHENGEFYSQQEIRELLEYAFDTLTSNGANKTEIGRQTTGRGASKVTSRHSESRVLHFKDADSWMEYQQKFGGLPFVDLVEAHVSGLSKDIALVENLGSNPKNAMRLLMDAAEQKDWANGLNPKDTNASRKRAQTMFEEFTGQNTPQSEVLANLGLAYRSMNVASMLGGTMLSSITDQAMIAKTASVHGIAYRKTFGELISQLNPKNKEDRDNAHSLGLATEEMLGSINRWSDDGLASTSGKAQKIARLSSAIATQIMRISGLNALTAASKVGFSKMLMNKYGTLTRSKSWDQVSDIDRELMEKTGINERAWKVMQVAEPIVDRKGNQLMSAKSIYQIPDEKIIGAMDDDFKKLQDNTDAQLNELNQRNFEDDQRIANKAQQIDDLKQQLSQRLQDYANRTDSKSSAEKQALKDRIDLLNTQNEVAAAQVDINAYLQAEKQSNRIQDFLQQVEDGRHSDKAAQDTRKNVERNAGQYGRRGEELGKRLGNAERRMVELRAKIRKAESEANKSIDKKFNELDKRVKSLDEEFSQYQTRVNDRQAKRSQAIEGITNSIDDNRKELAQKIRDEVASQFQAHILDEQGMAVVEAGLRERTWMSAGQKKGTAMGEIVKGILQFKSFPAAFLMRHGSRAMSMDKGTSKAAYGLSIFAMTTLLGALVVQLKEIANGNDPQTVWDSEDPNKLAKFFTRSAVQGGGLSVLGDILVAGADPSGRGTSDFIAGPLGSDVKTVLGVTVGNALQAYEGKDTNAANEIFKLIKSKVPAQNLWYTKAAMNRMIFDELQDVIAPGYREKLMRKAQREQDRTQWWGDDIGDIQAPDFDKVIQ
ncbi:hypothetical protein F938_00801 [Acinetobacter bereziniae LMG 1003 = CIP 70.12]|uniref:Uncharacterized protein n=1 Tax=Acinetobacter bereziniae LMG 1003 = CIP 70.12 TaxID=981324 RepID=N9DQJ5_ACIBZ|nr:hypothetical protein [Acinetobacter bereziniae]ENW00157.1 hypothetical protein F938_00801 [Acinetobacter bereziniae LMG 1003 = CIP 70.12]